MKRKKKKLKKMETEAGRLWKEYLAIKDKKPSWMIDENSTLGEVLEFRAVTMPFKLEQMIEIYDKMALDNELIAKILEDPADKKSWLEKADSCREKAKQMRLERPLYRLNAKLAQDEADKLI